MARQGTVLYVDIYVECSLVKGNTGESHLVAPACFPSTTPLAAVSTCVQEQGFWGLSWVAGMGNHTKSE